MAELAIVISAKNQAAGALDSLHGQLAKAEKQVNGLKQGMQSAGQTLQGFGAKMSLGVTAPLAGMGVLAINAASDLSESLSKVNVVFDQNAAAIEAWSKTASTSFGISQQQALESAGTFGNLFDAMGIGDKATAEMSTGLVQLASDLASFNNIDPTEALEKLRAGIVGETEPLRTLGVNLTAAAVEAKALEMGLAATADEMTESDKVTARYALIMESTANAQGDFARTSDGLANSQRIMKAQLTDAAAALGTQLLPYMVQAVQAVSQLVNWFGSLTPAMQQFVVIGGAAAAAIGPLAAVLGTVLTVVSALISPIGLVVAAVALLGVAWATNFGGIQEATAELWAVVQPILQNAYDWLMAQIPGALTTMQTAWDTTWAAVQAATTAAWAAIGPYLLSALAWLQTNAPAALSILQAAWDTTWSALQAAVDATWAVIGPYLQGALTWFQTDGPAALTAFQASWDATWAAIQEATDTAWAAVQGSLDTALTWFQTDAPGALTTLQSTWETTWSGLQETASAAWTQLEALFGPAMTRLQEAFGKAQIDVGALGPKFAELLEAIQNMWTAVQPVIQAFGALITAVWAVGSVLAVNLLAQAFSGFGTIAGAVIDQITLMINTFSEVITQVVALVQALVAGDWQAAWTAAQSIFGAFGNYFTETFDNLLTVTTTVISGITTAVTDTLTDMGVDTEAIMSGITGWWTSMWDGLTEKVQPVIDMIGEFRKTLEGFAEWVTGFSIPNPFDGWSMPSLPAMPWDSGTAAPGQNAIGTRNWRGGLTMVGETGPELVMLPRNSRIYGAQQTAAMQQRQAPTVRVEQMIVRNDLDIYALAYQVADLIARA